MAFFEIKSVPHKGDGAVATRQIPAGSMIVEEEPIFRVSKRGELSLDESIAFVAAVEGLSRENRMRFAKLTNNFPELDFIDGIIKTNAMPLGGERDQAGFFLLCAVFNHSCLPNAMCSWQSQQERQVIHATKAIAPGEEITVWWAHDRIWPFERTPRRQRLLAEFNFTCLCDLCTASDDERRASDERRLRIRQLRDRLKDESLLANEPAKALGLCKQGFGLVQDEDAPSPQIDKPLCDALKICLWHGDLARARSFALLCAKSAETCQGRTSLAYARYTALAEKPEEHSLVGKSQKWQQSAREAISLDADEFPSWLWRRAT